jgi:hypothetical protein
LWFCDGVFDSLEQLNAEGHAFADACCFNAWRSEVANTDGRSTQGLTADDADGRG